MAKKWKWVLFILLAICFIGGCAGGEEQTDAHVGGKNGATPVDKNRGNGEEPADDDGTAKEEEGARHPVVLYFSDAELTNVYKVRSEVKGNDNAEIVQATLDKWLTGPDDPSLDNLLPEGTTAHFEGAESGTAFVNLSADIRKANLGSGGEAAIVEQIVMLMEQFGYQKTQILVEGEVVETLLGHMQVNEPIQAKDPDQYEWLAEKGEPSGE
jgi:hypothetical protein